MLNIDTQIELINLSVKELRKNYYDLRSKKSKNLIKKFHKKTSKSTLGGAFFSKKA